jgi:hypothetical protein
VAGLAVAGKDFSWAGLEAQAATASSATAMHGRDLM